MPKKTEPEAPAHEGPEVELRIYWRSEGPGFNKDYVTTLERAADGLWVSNYAFGAHGKTLRPGTKMTKGPGTYAEAQAVFEAMNKERLKGGYVAQGEAGAAYVAPPGSKTHSGVQCQLLRPVADQEAFALLDDPAWFAQRKHDGERRLIRKIGEAVDGINRTGFVVGYAALSIPGDFVIDGEAVGQRLHAFDLLEVGGSDIRAWPAERRYARLADLLGSADPEGAIVLVEAAFTARDKKALYDRLLAEDREGIVFKRRGSPYSAGRPNSGGDQLKRKFHETCSAVVDFVNDQRSVGLKLARPAAEGGTEWVSVGNCTIPSNHRVPEVGAVVEIRYRKAHETGGLAEPVYLGQRTDISLDECVTEQLVYKPI